MNWSNLINEITVTVLSTTFICQQIATAVSSSKIVLKLELTTSL